MNREAICFSTVLLCSFQLILDALLHVLPGWQTVCYHATVGAVLIIICNLAVFRSYITWLRSILGDVGETN